MKLGRTLISSLLVAGACLALILAGLLLVFGQKSPAEWLANFAFLLLIPGIMMKLMEKKE